MFGDNCNEQIFLSHVFRGSKQIAYRQARQLSNLLVWQGRISAYFPSRFLNLLNPKHGLWKSSFYHWIWFFLDSMLELFLVWKQLGPAADMLQGENLAVCASAQRDLRMIEPFNVR